MDMLVFGQAERNLFGWLFHGGFRCNVDAALNFAYVLEIGVQPPAVARTQGFLKERDFLRHRIENTGALLSSQAPLFRTPSVAEQPLERHARIDLRGKGLGRRRPRDAVRVGTAITPIAVSEIAVLLHAELNGFEDRILAE